METITTRPTIIVQQSKSMADFKSGVDELLEKRSYFISQVLPNLKESADYHVIKGKKSLSKGGAEKIASIYGFTASFEQDDQTMKAFENVKGIIAFVCNLYKGGIRVGQGRGASTLSKNDNDPNKTLKMATKSSYIDGVIRASGLSDIFTQDLENMPVEAIADVPHVVQPVQDSITNNQKKLLISLLYQHIRNPEQRETWIESLDELTKAEASDQIQSFIEPR